jgi:hypothetical protein
LGNRRLAITSRKSTTLRRYRYLGGIATCPVSIQDEAANNDILTLVQEILNKDVKLRHWPPKVKNEIETALVSKSSGM